MKRSDDDDMKSCSMINGQNNKLGGGRKGRTSQDDDTINLMHSMVTRTHFRSPTCSTINCFFVYELMAVRFVSLSLSLCLTPSLAFSFFLSISIYLFTFFFHSSFSVTILDFILIEFLTLLKSLSVFCLCCDIKRKIEEFGMCMCVCVYNSSLVRNA